MTTALTIAPTTAPAVPPEAFPVTACHATALETSLNQPLDDAPLLPVSVLAQVRTELTNLPSATASEPEAARIAFTLSAAYPQKDSRTEQEAKAYLMALTDELMRFPLDVAREAALIVRRTVAFRPTPAEVVNAAEAIQARRCALLIAVERMEREHRRRVDAETLKGSHQAALQGDVDALHANLRHRFGDLAISARDFPHAQSGMQYAGNLHGDFQCRSAVEWLTAYRATEAWAVIAARRAAIFGRALRLYRTDVFRLGHLCAVGQALAQNDEEGAAHVVEQAEAGTMILVTPPVADRNTLRSCLAVALDRETCQRVADGAPHRCSTPYQRA